MKKKTISSMVIVLIFVAFLSYATISRIQYVKLREQHEAIQIEIQALREELDLCKGSGVQLLADNEKCNQDLTAAQSQLTKTTAELNNLKKN